MEKKIIKAFGSASKKKLKYQELIDIIFKDEKPDFDDIKDLLITLNDMVDNKDLNREVHSGEYINPTYELIEDTNESILKYNDFY